MGGLSIWHWMLVLLVVLLLFGGNKMSGLMGDFAKGIKAFKKNMAEPDDASMEDSASQAGRHDYRPRDRGIGSYRRERRRRRTDLAAMTGRAGVAGATGAVT